MSAGFLAASALGALNTLNAWTPFSRRGRASTLSFPAGWITSELPLHTIAAQAAFTGVAAARGDLKGGAGKLGLALSLASWGGLIALHREGQKSADVLEQALQDELGPDYRKGEEDPDTLARITRRQIATPAFRRHRRLTAENGRNLSYGEFGRRNRLDVLRRSDLPLDAKAPVLIYVHGGAWVIGEKEQQGGPMISHLAEKGWVCVSVNYRLSPRSTWPDHIVDVKRAIAWVKENIAGHGGDPSYIAIAGGSAGGHLASLAALSPNEPAFQPGFEDLDTAIQAAVPLYGVYDWTNRDQTGRADMEDFLARMVLKSELATDRDRWEQASTMTWVNEDAPPIFVIHGKNDSLVPVEQARSFVSMLRAVSNNPVVYAELPRTQHGFEVFGSVRAMHTARAIGRFLDYARATADG
jgi:acetyl esterase/lipase